MLQQKEKKMHAVTKKASFILLSYIFEFLLNTKKQGNDII